MVTLLFYTTQNIIYYNNIYILILSFDLLKIRFYILLYFIFYMVISVSLFYIVGMTS